MAQKANTRCRPDHLQCNKELPKIVEWSGVLPPWDRKLNVFHFECLRKENFVLKHTICPADYILCAHNHNSFFFFFKKGSIQPYKSHWFLCLMEYTRLVYSMLHMYCELLCAQICFMPQDFPLSLTWVIVTHRWMMDRLPGVNSFNIISFLNLWVRDHPWSRLSTLFYHKL